MVMRSAVTVYAQSHAGHKSPIFPGIQNPPGRTTCRAAILFALLLLVLFHVYRAGEVHGGGAFVLLLELIVLAGQDSVEGDADDGGDGEAGQADDADLDAAGVADADGQHEDERRDDDVAGVGEVHTVLHDVPHTDGGDHAVQDERHAADGGGGHGGDEGGKLRAEGDEDGDAGRDADDARVIDL